MEGSPEWEERAKASRASFDLAELSLEMGQFADAERYYRQALTMERELGDPFGVAANLHGLGVACGRQGRTWEAIDHLEAALRLNRDNGDGLEEAATLQELAELAKRQGEDGRYLALLLQAVDRFIDAREWTLLFPVFAKVALAAWQSPSLPALQAVWLGMRVEAPAELKATVALWHLDNLRLDQPLAWRLAAYSALLETDAGETATGWVRPGRGARALEACAQTLGVETPEACEAWIERERLRDRKRLLPALEAEIEKTVPKQGWRFNRAAVRGERSCG